MKKENRKKLEADRRRVLLAASECAPLSKTGGLADVAGALPKALAGTEIDMRVITPYHRCIKENAALASEVEHLFYTYLDMGFRHLYVGVERMVLDGVVFYLLDNEEMFGDRIYLGGDAEIEQYAFFSKAILEILPLLDFKPEVIHCNDWQTAVIPMLAKTQPCYREFAELRYLLTIHNIMFQGTTAFAYLRYLLNIDEMYNSPDFIELYGGASMLKAGCVFADRINTVSPSYAQEILTPSYGERLEGILSKRANEGALCGILNGIDNTVFDPETDAELEYHYSAADLSGKAKCKEQLQRELGLDISPDTPILAMVTRMTEQKGFSLIARVLDDLLGNHDLQFVLLGSGERQFESFMHDFMFRHKGSAFYYRGYHPTLANRIYAGSDFYLMPSLFEPCGISQMIAMRYGTLPIVRETGGLKDTVEAYDFTQGTGNGFSFCNYSAFEMRDAILYALQCTQDPEVKTGLIWRAMKENYDIRKAALAYRELFLDMLGR